MRFPSLDRISDEHVLFRGTEALTRRVESTRAWQAFRAEASLGSLDRQRFDVRLSQDRTPSSPDKGSVGLPFVFLRDRHIEPYRKAIAKSAGNRARVSWRQRRRDGFYPVSAGFLPVTANFVGRPTVVLSGHARSPCSVSSSGALRKPANVYGGPLGVVFGRC